MYFGLNNGFKKNYINTPALAEGLIYAISDEQITIDGVSMKATLPWPTSFKSATQIGKWLLLFSSSTSAYFLNTEKLVEPATISDVNALFIRKGIKLKK